MNAFESLPFRPADILLPKDCEYSKWSVVACDQYTSQPEYWQRVAEYVGRAPSALRLILPESCLEGPNVETDIMEVNNTMTRYLREERFCTLPASLIYVERRLDNLRLRRGLVGMVDLEQYDYEPGAEAQVRATEGTVMARIPPRVAVRKNAPLELPHVMLLADDPEKTVLEPLSARKDQMEKVYDFDLMERGGHIAGWRVSGETKAAVQSALDALDNAALQREKYGDAAENGKLTFAVGDGNHSLAAAKRFWEEKRETLPENERETDPARFALVEIENIHEPSLDFEPIHRVIFDTDTSTFAAEFTAHRTEWEAEDKTLGERVAAAESFCRAYIAAHGGYIDYIHGDDTARALGEKPNCAAVLLPPVEKSGLFLSVLKNGALPKKSFSMGNARDKRYYLECRKIR